MSIHSEITVTQSSTTQADAATPKAAADVTSRVATKDAGKARFGAGALPY